MFRTVALLVFILGLTACGRPVTRRQQVVPLSPEKVEQVLNNQVFNCPAEGCPEGVGRLILVDTKRGKGKVCTSFLIGPTTVMTNSHCVFLDNNSKQKTCEYLHFAFPEKWGHSHLAGCKQILRRDPKPYGDSYTRVETDFAIIELDRKIPLAALEIDPKGLTKGQMVHPLVIDHLNANETTLHKLSCKVEYVDERSGMTKLAKCPVISGNSGSAIVDENNKVVGIMFGSDNDTVRKPGSLVVNSRQYNGYALNMKFVMKRLKNFFKAKAKTKQR